MDFQLIIDTALVVLIWLVQLIIYPVFEYMNPKELKNWHRIYVPRITIIVAPLMILQLIFYLSDFEFGAIAVIQSFALVGIWLNTFLQAVPLHSRIFTSEGDQIKPALQKLLRVNWIRTVLWSILWLMHFLPL
jgi:hypothetical protein